jgi:chemotaxis protein methyltransferase CheR
VPGDNRRWRSTPAKNTKYIYNPKTPPDQSLISIRGRTGWSGGGRAGVNHQRQELGVSRLTERQFKRFCELVYRESGINLTEEKRELLHARLAKRLRVRQLDPEAYLSLIECDTDELRAFLDAISTNHTFFFRESRSFRLVPSSCRRIWCAACSSGEEPYSILIHCHEHGFAPSILATDISESCLSKARRGIYSRQSVANMPQSQLRAFFQRGQGEWSGHVRVKESLRARVSFARFNLLKDRLPEGSFDVIFCRNVMIYFDRPTKEHVVHRLCQALAPGGLFIIGGAESLSGLKHPLTYIEPSVYRL